MTGDEHRRKWAFQGYTAFSCLQTVGENLGDEGIANIQVVTGHCFLTLGFLW